MPVGRSDELRRLARLIADDVPAVVLGEAGVGKTTLLRAATADSGRRVLEGGALSTLDWLDFLALERALGRPMIAGDPTAVAADVEPAVGNAVLLLDDLHWAAPATLEVVAHLAGRVGLVAGIRSGEPGTDRALEQLRGAGFEVVELTGLTAAEAAELVTELRPDLGAAGRERLVARTGGNPLLLRELAATGEPSSSLRLALEARLRRLDAVGREAFAILALAGRPVSTAALGDAGVKSLLDADLAVPVPSGIEVRHALLAEVTVAGMDAAERAEVHARIAASVDDDGEAARHYQLAGMPAEAYAAAMRAVDATTRPGEQARHLAVAAACASGPRADDLRLRAAHALEVAHEWTEMVATLDRIDPGNVTAQGMACLLRARGAYSAGDVEGLRTSITAGLELVGGSGTATEVRLRIEQTRIPLFIAYDAETALPMARRGLDLAQEHGIDVPRAHYLLGTALAIFAEPGAVEHLTAAIAAAHDSGDTSTEFLAVANLVSTHEMAGDPQVGRQLCHDYVARARQLGLGEWERLIRVALASLDFHAGDYEATIAAAEELLTQPLDKRGFGQLVEMFGVALVDVGRADEALRRLDAVADNFVGDSRGQMELLWVRTEAALWGGRSVEAVTLAEQYMDFPDQDANASFGAPTRAWALWDLDRDPGDPPEVQDIPMVLGIPVEVEAIGALHRGDAERAAELFTRAAELWAPYHRRGELRSLWGAGEAIHRVDRAAGVQLLEAVEARAQQHGMLPLLARVHRSLRAAGERRSAPRTRSAGSTLTGRQREVLGLVAEGLTNAQIAHRLGISRHTVVTQLASASAKLGATSRAQAASLAARPT